MKLVRDGRLRLIHGYICGLFGERNIIICFYDTVVSRGRRYRWIQVLYRGPLRAIPTRRLTATPTRHRATAVAERPVGSEISKMFDISRRSFSRLAILVTRRPVAQLANKKAIPTG